MHRIQLTFLTSLIFGTAVLSTGQDLPSSTVVFACEHGSAKSVIAAAHFNRIAEKRGLPYRAISRGVHPDSEIPIKVKTPLRADGLDVSRRKPKLISDDDIRHASRLITIACKLPQSIALDPGKLEDWADVPPLENGYPMLRAAMLQKIEALLSSLQKSTPK